MRVLQKIDGRARFDEQKNLSGLFDRGKFGDRLLHTIVENMKVIALQALDEIPLPVCDDYADVHPVDVYLNGLALGEGYFLRAR